MINGIYVSKDLSKIMDLNIDCFNLVMERVIKEVPNASKDFEEIVRIARSHEYVSDAANNITSLRRILTSWGKDNYKNAGIISALDRLSSALYKSERKDNDHYDFLYSIQELVETSERSEYEIEIIDVGLRNRFIDLYIQKITL